MDAIEKLAAMFAEFPGIGPRQARRFVYFLLRKNRAFAAELAKLIPTLSGSVRVCERCHRYHEAQGSGKTCRICSSPDRDETTLLVVARDADLEGVERSQAFRGRYFVLGGTVPVLEKEPERLVRLNELAKRISDDEALTEVVVATNATPEGDYTAGLVRESLESLAAPRSLKITLLGRGLSTGSELEYADPDTVRAALKGRG